jgi:outer membrane protein assembly factor BamB
VAERAANGGSVTGATRLSAGYWYFVSMTYDGTTLSVAVNGNTEAQAAVGAITAAPATHVRLGASSAGAATSDWLACGIQTVQIWAQALTPSALLDAVRTNLAGNEPNLQAYFNFVFGTARDWTGHGPDGVLSSAFFQASTIGEQPIHYARALSGSGVGYIDCGGGRSLNLTNAMTLEAWIRIDRFTDPNQVIMAKGEVYQIRRYGTTNQITFSTAGLQPQAAAELPSTAAVNLVDGAWHHVCAVYDGSSKKLYIDGALNASVAAVGSLAAGNGVLYVADNDGEVLVLDQETGNELWTARTFKAISTSPVVDKNVVCVSSPTGNIFAFDTDTQRRLWDAQIPPGYQVPLRIHRDQVLYSGAGTAISAIDLLTGASAWNLNGLANDAAPAVYGNTALFCANYSIFSRDITTTRLNWAYNLPDKALAAPVVDLSYAFVNCGDNNVYALSLDGVVGRAGSYQATAALIGAPSVHDHNIYIATADGTITALGYSFGSFNQIWTASLGTTLAQPIVVAAPFVAAIGADNVLRVFNAVSGTAVWTWSRAANGVNLALSGLTVVNGAAYLSLSSGIYIALDIVNQKVLWEKDLQTIAVAAAAVTYAPFCIGASVSAKGVVAPGTFDGLVAEVRLWSAARTADQIALSWDRRMVGDEAGLAGYWSCSSAGAGLEQDLSGNLNPGAVVGAVPACEVDFFLKDPTPRLVAQSRMMQDWSQGDISANNPDGTVAFRTEVSFLDGNARPLLGALVRLWTDEAATIVANGTSYNTDNANAAVMSTDARGMITVITACNALTTPTLQLWADYMAENERVIIHPDSNLTETLASISGKDIVNPGASSNPLLRDKTTLFPSLTEAQADGIAQAVNNAIQTVKKPAVNASPRRVSLKAMMSGVAAAPGSGGAVSSVIELTGPDQYARYVGSGDIPHWKFDFGNFAFTPMTQMEVDAHLAALAPHGLVATTELAGASLWDDFVNGVKKAANFVITKIGEAVQVVVSWVQSGIQTLTHIFQSVAEVGQALFGIFKQLLDTVVDAAKKIYRFFAFLFDWDDILVTKNALVQNVRDVFGQLNAKIDWAITQEKSFFDDIENRIDGGFKSLIGLLGKQNLSMINDAAPSLQPMLPGAPGGVSASVSAQRFAVLDQQRGAYGVEGNWLMSTSLANSGGITGGAVTGYDADAFGSLSQVFQEIYAMIQGGKAVAAFKNAEDCFRQIGTNPESFLQLSLQGILEALRGLADLAVEICKAVTTLLLRAVKGLFALLMSALTAPIDIPVVSWLYGKISGGAALSVLDLMALIVAIPTTVIYKAFTGTAPFAPTHPVAEASLAAAGLTPTQKGLKTAGGIALLLNIPLAILADLQAVTPPVPSERSSLIPKPFPQGLKTMFEKVDVKRIGPNLGPNLLRWVSFGLQTIGYFTNAPWIYSSTPTTYDIINWIFGAAEFVVVQGTFAVMASVTGEVWAVSWMIPCVVGCLRLVIWLVSLFIALVSGTALDPAKVASGFFSPQPAAWKFLRKPEIVASTEGLSLAALAAIDLVAGGIPPAITLGTTWA